MKTATEIIEFVYDKLMIQGKRSIMTIETATYTRVSCRYRATDGSRCAIGWLIPDAKYNLGLESWPVNSSNIVKVLEDLGLPYRGNENIFIRLQLIHDSTVKDFTRTVYTKMLALCKLFSVDAQLKDPSTYEV